MYIYQLVKCRLQCSAVQFAFYPFLNKRTSFASGKMLITILQRGHFNLSTSRISGNGHMCVLAYSREFWVCQRQKGHHLVGGDILLAWTGDVQSGVSSRNRVETWHVQAANDRWNCRISRHQAGRIVSCSCLADSRTFVVPPPSIPSNCHPENGRGGVRQSHSNFWLCVGRVANKDRLARCTVRICVS